MGRQARAAHERAEGLYGVEGPHDEAPGRAARGRGRGRKALNNGSVHGAHKDLGPSVRLRPESRRQRIPAPAVVAEAARSGCAVIANAMSMGGVMRKAFLGMCVLGTLAFAQVSFAQETGKKELREHPRIAAAIRELHGAIEYMERAPHDFGGHKGSPIAARRSSSFASPCSTGHRRKAGKARSKQPAGAS